MCNAKPIPNVMNETMARMKALMKTLVAVLMLGGVLSIEPTAVVWAGPFDGALYSAQYSTQYQGNPAAKGHDKRQVRDARNAQPQPQPPRERPRGHLTEEERRQLHRDLDKANRELYGGNRRRTVPAD